MGAGNSSVDVRARGNVDLLARSVQEDASSNANTSSIGILSSEWTTPLNIRFSDNGRLAALASQSSIAESLSTYGTAITTLNNTSIGLQNLSLQTDNSLVLNSRASSSLSGTSRSIHGNVAA